MAESNTNQRSTFRSSQQHGGHEGVADLTDRLQTPGQTLSQIPSFLELQESGSPTSIVQHDYVSLTNWVEQNGVRYPEGAPKKDYEPSTLVFGPADLLARALIKIASDVKHRCQNNADVMQGIMQTAGVVSGYSSGRPSYDAETDVETARVEQYGPDDTRIILSSEIILGELKQCREVIKNARDQHKLTYDEWLVSNENRNTLRQDALRFLDEALNGRVTIVRRSATELTYEAKGSILGNPTELTQNQIRHIQDAEIPQSDNDIGRTLDDMANQVVAIEQLEVLLLEWLREGWEVNEWLRSKGMKMVHDLIADFEHTMTLRRRSGEALEMVGKTVQREVDTTCGVTPGGGNFEEVDLLNALQVSNGGQR